MASRGKTGSGIRTDSSKRLRWLESDFENPMKKFMQKGER